MTVIVGTRCSDGIVIGTDSISTSANGRHPLIQVRSDEKLRIVGDSHIVVGTGSVGLGQRFERVVEDALKGGVFDQPRHECLRKITRDATDDHRSTSAHFARDGQGLGFGAMLAGPVGGDLELVEFNTFDFQPECKTAQRHFVSMGTGQILADPFLAFVSRVLWAEQQPTVATAVIGVCWALEHAIKFAPGGVGEPIKIGVIRAVDAGWHARVLDDGELLERRQHISEIERIIGQYALGRAVNGAPAPKPPEPLRKRARASSAVSGPADHTRQEN